MKKRDEVIKIRSTVKNKNSSDKSGGHNRLYFRILDYNWKLLIIILILIIFLIILIYFIAKDNNVNKNNNLLINNNTLQDNKGNFGECNLDRDCSPVCGCHVNSCIPLNQKGNCEKVFCSMECSGSLDCNAGYCGCVNGKCKVIAN